MTIAPNILILGSKYDFSCDYIVACLDASGDSYLRLNSEDLHGYTISFDPCECVVTGENEAIKFSITPQHLQSVLFRRPVYLREYGVSQGISGQHTRLQWAALLRNLMVFDKCLWVNNPRETYVAEHKGYQLRVASSLGFSIPKTIITNDKREAIDTFQGEPFVVKGLDTVLLRDQETEYFGFTHALTPTEFNESTIKSAPTIIQENISSKIDLRITVVGSTVLSASIKRDGQGIYGDWRVNKQRLQFKRFELPDTVSQTCIQLVRKLGLQYGAIDLMLSDGEYFFVEVNPTGEWAWLVNEASLPIDEAFAKLLRC